MSPYWAIFVLLFSGVESCKPHEEYFCTCDPPNHFQPLLINLCRNGATLCEPCARHSQDYIRCRGCPGALCPVCTQPDGRMFTFSPIDGSLVYLDPETFGKRHWVKRNAQIFGSEPKKENRNTSDLHGSTPRDNTMSLARWLHSVSDEGESKRKGAKNEFFIIGTFTKEDRDNTNHRVVNGSMSVRRDKNDRFPQEIERDRMLEWKVMGVDLEGVSRNDFLNRFVEEDGLGRNSGEESDVKRIVWMIETDKEVPRYISGDQETSPSIDESGLLKSQDPKENEIFKSRRKRQQEEPNVASCIMETGDVNRCVADLLECLSVDQGAPMSGDDQVIPDEEWCPLGKIIRNGNLRCVYRDQHKSCRLRCQEGYNYRGKSSAQMECSKGEKRWKPEHVVCKKGGTQQPQAPPPPDYYYFEPDDFDPSDHSPPPRPHPRDHPRGHHPPMSLFPFPKIKRPHSLRSTPSPPRGDGEEDCYDGREYIP